MVRTELQQPDFKRIEEGSTLALRPSFDMIAWRSVYTLIVSGNSAQCTLDDDDHMIGDEFVIAVECEPRRTPSPAAALEARSEHVIKRCRAFGRAVGEARRPVCPRKLPVSMLEAQVNNAGHRGARIGKLATAGDGCKFVVVSGCPSSMWHFH